MELTRLIVRLALQVLVVRHELAKPEAVNLEAVNPETAVGVIKVDYHNRKICLNFLLWLRFNDVAYCSLEQNSILLKLTIIIGKFDDLKSHL